MRQRGRKSTADLVSFHVDGSPSRLNPPASLSEAERSLFTELVAANTPEHFRPSDLPLLARYCEATVLAEQAAQELRRGAVVDGKVNPWLTVQEKAVRAMVALSMRLRLSPQSRIDPKTLGRQQAYMGPRPWEIGA
jgi:phage terminase small subunit